MHVALQETDTVDSISHQRLAMIYFQLNSYLMGHPCEAQPGWEPFPDIIMPRSFLESG